MRPSLRSRVPKEVHLGTYVVRRSSQDSTAIPPCFSLMNQVSTSALPSPELHQPSISLLPPDYLRAATVATGRGRRFYTSYFCC